MKRIINLMLLVACAVAMITIGKTGSTNAIAAGSIVGVSAMLLGGSI